MMTCNFLKRDSLKRFMEPLWGRNKKYIVSTVRKYTKLFAINIFFQTILCMMNIPERNTFVGELIPWVLNLKRTKCYFFFISLRLSTSFMYPLKSSMPYGLKQSWESISCSTVIMWTFVFSLSIKSLNRRSYALLVVVDVFHGSIPSSW